jgi:hypothetical protein
MFPLLEGQTRDEAARTFVLDRQGRLLDARYRLLACLKAGIAPRFVVDDRQHLADRSEQGG